MKHDKHYDRISDLCDIVEHHVWMMNMIIDTVCQGLREQLWEVRLASFARARRDCLP